MWLHNYLLARSEVPNDDEKQTSVSFLISWATFGGVRPKILRGTGESLESLNKAYMGKFQSLPENMFTRAMMLVGLILGPWAPIPIILCDLIALITMTAVFLTGWIAGGAITLTFSGLAWVVGGNSAASSVFEAGTSLTENIMCVILSLLSIPAGLVNLIGMIPSAFLELITECINYGCISVVHSCYKANCANTCHLPITEKTSVPPGHSQPRPININNSANNDAGNNLNTAVLEKPNTLLFQSEAEIKPYEQVTRTAEPLSTPKADDSLAADLLRDVGNKSLPQIKIEIV